MWIWLVIIAIVIWLANLYKDSGTTGIKKNILLSKREKLEIKGYETKQLIETHLENSKSNIKKRLNSLNLDNSGKRLMKKMYKLFENGIEEINELTRDFERLKERHIHDNSEKIFNITEDFSKYMNCLMTLMTFNAFGNTNKKDDTYHNLEIIKEEIRKRYDSLLGIKKERKPTGLKLTSLEQAWLLKTLNPSG